MKVIIAGGREFSPNNDSIAWVLKIINELHPDEIISGCARGADTFGEKLAEHLNIPVRKFPANWKFYGKAAGPIRNEQMANYADACILFPGDRGTDDMRRRAKEHGLVLYEYTGVE